MHAITARVLARCHAATFAAGCLACSSVAGDSKPLFETSAHAQVVVLHAAAFTAGYYVARSSVAGDSKPLARCISLETGMQVQAGACSAGRVCTAA